jgi:hypothetical protein
MMKHMLKRSQITEALDQTTECLEHGETVDECLAHHPDLSDEMSGLIGMRSQPTTTPSHQPEPGPAQEGSPKRTTSNLPLMPAG